MTSDESGPRHEERDLLRSWVLFECTIGRSDPWNRNEHSLRDKAERVFGFRAERALSDYVNERRLSVPEVEAIAANDAALDELLAYIKAAQRPGFEAIPPKNSWDARLARIQQGLPPEALLVMAEYGIRTPVWDQPLGNGSIVDLAKLGVSEDLIQALTRWNDAYGEENDEILAAWTQEGLDLAYQLQAELPDIDVRYWHEDDDRALREIPRS